MSSFTTADVQRLALLARLELSDAETASFARQLGDILEFARQVQGADAPGHSDDRLTPGVVLSPAEASREDVPTASLPREVALAAAPDADAKAGLFKVPRVFNG